MHVLANIRTLNLLRAALEDGPRGFEVRLAWVRTTCNVLIEEPRQIVRSQVLEDLLKQHYRHAAKALLLRP